MEKTLKNITEKSEYIKKKGIIEKQDLERDIRLCRYEAESIIKIERINKLLNENPLTPKEIADISILNKY
ncbi:MAG: hypothetical protein PHN88_12205 [Ignavibacteria bacterium]|nr:hypothetical protein [Ignavibacteria bacterium]